MNSPESIGLDSLDLFGIVVNGITVPAFDQSGSRWYQLAVLFRALDSPEANMSCLSSKAGNLFFDSGEFQKYRDKWYGTIKGLYLFVDYLCESRILLYNNQDQKTARARFDILTKWLSGVDDGDDTPSTAEQPSKDSTAYESATNTVPVPTDTPEGNPGIAGIRDESGVAHEPDSDEMQILQVTTSWW